MNFNPAGKMPGVYINEADVAGPIVGVATSTAAFIGPAAQGPMLKPVKITNWTEFKKNFGEGFKDRVIFSPYAVKGFFENGGSNCYFVRVGKAKKAECTVTDRAGKDLFSFKSLFEGEGGNNCNIIIEDKNAASTHVDLTATVTAIQADGAEENKRKKITVVPGEALKFIKGDKVVVAQKGVEGTNASEIVSIDGNDITLKDELTLSFDTTVQDKPVVYLENVGGRKSIALAEVENIESGTYLTFKQGKGQTAVLETKRVDSINISSKTVTLNTPLKSNFPLDPTKPVEVLSNEFSLKITDPDGNIVVDFDSLVIDNEHSKAIFKQDLKCVDVEINIFNDTMPPQNLPKAGTYPITGGMDEFSSPIDFTDYEAGIDVLKTVEDINMVCAPDCTNIKDSSGSINVSEIYKVQQKLISHCEEMMDRFAILDSILGNSVEEMKNHRNELGSKNGYGAIYYPWVIAPALSGSGNMLVPPSGFVAGLFARSDNLYGVHQAPAGEYLPLKSVLGLETELDSTKHGDLNTEGINVLRILKGIGTVVWGARTLAPKSSVQWRYVNVRRLMLYIEESILEATRSSLFRPNNQSLWQTIKRQVNGFLMKTWQNGALIGTTADKAFSVKIDEELNPPDTVSQGMLFIEVKVYPTTPAEFIVFQIIQQPGGPVISE